MSLDSHSIERLKRLGRQLPKKLETSKESQNIDFKSKESIGKHPVEVEENPQKLFHELINISSDGHVPSHLIDRLKDMESNQSNTNNNDINKSYEKNDDTDKRFQQLYTDFNQLLLEDDI